LPKIDARNQHVARPRNQTLPWSLALSLARLTARTARPVARLITGESSGGGTPFDPAAFKQALLINDEPFYTEAEWAGNSHMLKNYGTLGQDAPGYASQWAVSGNRSNIAVELGTPTIPPTANFKAVIHYYNRRLVTNSSGIILGQRGPGSGHIWLVENGTEGTTTSLGRLSLRCFGLMTSIEIPDALVIDAWHRITIERNSGTMTLTCERYGASPLSASAAISGSIEQVQTKLLAGNTPSAAWANCAVSHYSVTTGGHTTHYPLCEGPGADGTNAIKGGSAKTIFRVMTDHRSFVPSWAIKYGARITANRVQIPALLDSSIAADGNALTIQPGKFGVGTIDTNPLGDATAAAWGAERTLIPSTHRSTLSTGKRLSRIASGMVDRLIADSDVIANAATYCSIDSAPLQQLFFVFVGESNAGGTGVNASATAGELAARSSVRIWHNTAFAFEDLDVGTNNLIDHANLADNATHGMEIGLANEVEANTITGISQVMLAKHGVGGSRLIHWDGSTYYIATNELPMEIVTHREGMIKDYLAANAISPVYVVMSTIGINDQIASVTAAAWKPQMLAQINRLKRTYDGALIVMTKFMTGRTLYDTVIDELATEEDNVVAISGDATYSGDHWDYGGLKTMAQRLVSEV